MRVDRILAEHDVKSVELDDGAVGAAAGIHEREIDEDGARRKREVRVLERGVVHLRGDRKRRDDVLVVIALHTPLERKCSGRLHLVEVVRVDRWHERKNVPEVGGGRLERKIEREPLPG